MTTNGSPIDVRSAAATHVGTVRKLNEDAIFEGPDIGVYAVADGMGGHDAGDVASRAIVDVLRGMDRPDGPAHLMHAVREALANVNNDLRALAHDRGPDAVIGSTIAVVLISDVHMAGLWAGDSRIYRLRNGRLKQLSRDHSYVQELVDSGKLTPEEAETHPKGNIITRAVGAADVLELDAVRDRLEPGDRLLICSDGLVRAVTDGEIERHLQQGRCDRVADALIDEALTHGARDNVSVVVVDYGVPVADERPVAGLEDITLPPEDTVDGRRPEAEQTHQTDGDLVDDMTILGFAARPGGPSQPAANAPSQRGQAFVDPRDVDIDSDPILRALAEPDPADATPAGPPVMETNVPGDPAEQTVFGGVPPGQSPLSADFGASGPTHPGGPADHDGEEDWTDQTILGFRSRGSGDVPADLPPADPRPAGPVVAGPGAVGPGAVGPGAAEPPPPEPMPAPTPLDPKAPSGGSPDQAEIRFETDLGRYELRERVGTDGSADVYRAYDPMVGRPAAVKLMHVGALGGQDGARRFVQSAKALGSLLHPNIATVFEVGETSGRPFVVTEQLEGQTLAEILSDGVPRTLHSALSIGLQLCNALDHAHKRGVAHRNINPGSIVILDHDRTVKVTDFGLQNPNEAQPNIAAGSFPAAAAMHYLAPEVLSSADVDDRADLYAVGAVMYQMLSGLRPFEGDSQSELIAKILSAEPAPLPADVPKSVASLVFQLLSKDRNQRIQSADELGQAIGREMQHLENRHTAKRRRRGLKGWAAATALIAMVLLAQSVLLGALVVASRNTPPSPPAPTLDQTDRVAVLATERLSYAVAEDALTSAWEVATEHLEVMAADEGASAAVLGEDGVVLASAGSDLPAVGDALAGIPMEDTAAGRPTVVPWPAAETPVGFLASVSVELEDGQSGRLAVLVPAPPPAEVAVVEDVTPDSDLVTLGLVATLLALAAVLLINAILRGGLQKALDKVHDGMEQVGEGNLHVTLPTNRRDDIGTLYRQFNQMVARLRQRDGIPDD